MTKKPQRLQVIRHLKARGHGVKNSRIGLPFLMTPFLDFPVGAGTLTLLPLGGAELRDTNGKLLGTLAPSPPVQGQSYQAPSYGQPAGVAR